MLEKYCDILVIGTELPGLVTAAFLARRGLSVQIIEPDFYADNMHMTDPLCLTSVHSKLLRSILGRLNVPEVTIQNFLNEESNLQFIFPKKRIDVSSSPLVYAEELEREFPEHQQTLHSFYEELARLRHKTDVNDFFQQLLPTTWGERRAFSKFVSSHHLNDKNADYAKITASDATLNAYLKAQYLLSYQRFCAQPFSYQVAELCNPGDGEIFSIIGGQKSLKKILLDRVLHHDGHIRQKISPQTLLFRNGVFEGVEMAGTQDTVLAKYIMWNAALPKLKELLPKKWRYRGLRKQCDGFEPSDLWFTARFTINKDYIPDPMTKNVVLLDDPTAEFQGGNFVYLQVGPVDNEGNCTLDAHFLLHKSALNEDNAYFRPYFEAIQKRLIALMPFSEDALKLSFPREDTEKDQDMLFPLNENDFEIFRHNAKIHGVSTQDEKSFTHLFPLHYKTPTPNLFITHPNVFGAFGLESKLMLGLKITDLVWQETEKEKKRAMKTERRIA